MKISRVVFIICLVFSSLMSNSTTAKAEEVLDFYIYPGNSNEAIHECLINNEPCWYHEAVQPGKKPSKPSARFIGSGRIDYKKIKEHEDELEQARITVFTLINLQLDKDLGLGIKTIQDFLDTNEGGCYNSPRLKEMLKKLKKKIKEEFSKNGSTENVVKGKEILKKFECQK